MRCVCLIGIILPMLLFTDFLQSYAGNEESVQRIVTGQDPPNGHSYFDVARVESDDFLYIRVRPYRKSAEVGKIPHDGKCVKALGQSRQVGNAVWLRIQYKCYPGWVNSRYLTPANNCE